MPQQFRPQRPSQNQQPNSWNDPNRQAREYQPRQMENPRSNQNYDDVFGPSQSNSKSSYKEPMSKKKKVLFAAGGGTVVVIAILASIVGFTNTGNSPILGQNTSLCVDDVELTWTKPILPGQDKTVFTDIVDNFENTYSNVSIEMDMVEYNSDYYDNLIKSFAKRTGPDIFSIRNDDLPAYQEFMTPITSFTKNRLATYKTDFVDLAVKDTMIKDSVYGVTLYVDNLQLYYNDTILKQNNIAQAATNWNDLDSQIVKIRKVDSDFQFTQYPVSLGTGGLLNGNSNIDSFQDVFTTMLMQKGQGIYDYKEQSSTLNNSSNSDITGENIAKDYLEYGDKLSNKYSWNVSAENNLKTFIDGDLAYMFGYQEIGDQIKLRNSRLDFEVVQLPQLNSNRTVTSGKFFMDGLSKALEYDHEGTSKKYCAEEFLYYLTTKQEDETVDAGKFFSSQTRFASSRKDIVSDQIDGSDKSVAIFAKGSLNAASYYKPNVQAVENIWSSLFEDIQILKKPSDEAWNDAVSKYRTLVKKGPQIR